MAVQDNESPSLPGPRLSPGDAAFERLTRRAALKAKDMPAVAETPPEMAADPVPAAATFVPEPTPEAEPAATPPPVPALASEAKQAPMVESAGIEDDAIVTSPAIEPVTAGAAVSMTHETTHVDPAMPKPAIDDPTERIIAVAAALGVEVTPLTPPAPVQAAPAPLAQASPALPAKTSAPRPSAVKVTPPAADATAARLEAALLDQLKTLEETLQPRMPRAEPLRRPSPFALEEPELVGPPRRSSFAPDPVRQRTYVDLRAPAPAPERAASDDPPWRKYLAEPRHQGSRHAVSIHAEAQRADVRPSALVSATHDSAGEAQERARGIRAMSAAAVLGLGVGLGLLVLIRPFAESVSAPVQETAETVVADAAPPLVHAAADPAGAALATLLAEPIATRAVARQPAVITEPGVVVAPETVTAEAAAPAPPAVPAVKPPIVIRPPPGEARRVARVPDFDTAETGPLAYVPVIPSYDPVRQSLLDKETPAAPAPESRGSVAAQAPVDERPVSRDIRPGRATINTFVNMRSKPDNRAPVVAILADGLSVRVISCDYWCEVEAGGKRGFVFKSFVTR